jgi:hypothetical protein
MTLNAPEFIRRFAMHIMPKGFVRIRHYGILASSVKGVSLPSIMKQFGIRILKAKDTPPVTVANDAGYDCPLCKKGRMIIVCYFDYRGPPPHWKAKCHIPTPVQEAV